MSLTVPESASVLSLVSPPLLMVVVEPVLLPMVLLNASVGATVSTISMPAGFVAAPVRTALLVAVSWTVAEFRLNAVTVRSAVFCVANTVWVNTMAVLLLPLV